MGLATTSGNLVARCLLEKKVNFVPCRVELGRITPLIPINQKIMKYFVYLMHGSILLLTMPPPPRAHPRVFAIFFFLGGLFPTPGHTERDNSPPPSSRSTLYTFFCYIFFTCTKAKRHVFTIYKHFPEFIERSIMDFIMLVKTWTIIWKRKRRRKSL